MRSLLFLGLLSASSAFAAPVSLVALSNNHAGQNGAPVGSGTLARLGVDGQVHASTIIDRSGVAMAWDGRLDRTYAVLHDDHGAQLLVEVDPYNLAVSREIGLLADVDDNTFYHKVTALAVDEDGALFGVASRRTWVGGLPVPVGVLVAIDPDTARATTIGTLGFPVYGRGGAIQDGSFFLICHTDRVDTTLTSWRVDLADGTPTALGVVGARSASVGVAEDDRGGLWAVLGDDQSHLYAIDPQTGAGTVVGSTGLGGLSGLTFVRELWTRHLAPAVGEEDDCDDDEDDCDDDGTCEEDRDEDDCDADDGDEAPRVLAPFEMTTAAVAEARIGDLGGKATFELDVGLSTAAPKKTAQKAWVRGTAYPFRVTVPPGGGNFTFELDGQVLDTAPAGAGRDLSLRARSTKTSSRARLTSLRLDGEPLDVQVDTAGPHQVDGVDIVHVHTRWLDDGFTLTGELTFDWDPRDTPKNSHLAVQIGWGEAVTQWR